MKLSDFNFDGSLYHEQDYIGFGKYKHKTWKQVKELDPGYLIWMAGASEDMPSRKKFIDKLFSVELDLMPDQLAAAEAITDELINGNNRVYRLQGGAGYGKSYTVMEVAQRAKRAGFNVVAMANSYVASQVMAESLNPVGIEPSTIARALALRPDNTSYDASYGPSPETEDAVSKLMANGNLLIVDEDTMCSDSAVDIVWAKMNEPGNTAKLLSVGDKKQLPSPEQEHLCEFTNILPAFQLSIPKRFDTESDLYALEMALAEDPFTLVNALNSLQGDEVIKHESFGALCVQMISDIESYPDDSGLMLFFRRDAVAYANRTIRALAYGDDIEPLVEGERLRIMRTSFMPVRWDYEKGAWLTLKFYSGRFVISRDPAVEEVVIDFKQPDLPQNTLEPIVVECYCITDPEGERIPVLFSKTEHQADPVTVGGKEFNKGLEKVKQYCIETNNWQCYHYYRAKFVQVAYGYATTVHRSQGASVDRIYMNPKDVLQGGSMAASLAYVAGTRAKKQIHYVIDEVEDNV